MRATLRKALEAEQQRHQDALEVLAEKRIDAFEQEWRRTRKTSIVLVFGMGCFDVLKNGRSWGKFEYPHWPKMLNDLDRDLDDITDQYRAACPKKRTI